MRIGLLLAVDSTARSVRILQWLVIALIFVFFLVTLRVIANEKRAVDRNRDGGSKRGRAGSHLVVQMILADGNVGERHDVQEELTIGRSASNDLSTASDAYTSSNHARVYRTKRRLYVEDLGSTNGTYVNTERIARPTRLHLGDRIFIGSTELEVTQ